MVLLALARLGSQRDGLGPVDLHHPETAFDVDSSLAGGLPLGPPHPQWHRATGEVRVYRLLMVGRNGFAGDAYGARVGLTNAL